MEKVNEAEVPKPAPEPKETKDPMSPVRESVLKTKRKENIPGKVERLDG